MTTPRAFVYQALDQTDVRRFLRLSEGARRVQSPGRTYGSMTDEGLDYSAVPGSAMPLTAWSLYNALGRAARAITERDLRIIHAADGDADYALALNVLAPGQSYELHRDTAAWNLLVFLTRHDSGAAFHLCHPDGEPLIQLRPTPGLGVLFDGVTLPHYTNPNRTAKPRVALVCQYPDPDAEPVRDPAHLAHFYGAA